MNRLFDQQKRALNWAQSRGLLRAQIIQPQALKLVEEVGELIGAVLKNDTQNQHDELGDVLVCLTVLADQLGLDWGDCLRRANDKIENRTGKTENGVFIKAEAEQTGVANGTIPTF